MKARVNASYRAVLTGNTEKVPSTKKKPSYASVLTDSCCHTDCCFTALMQTVRQSAKEKYLAIDCEMVGDFFNRSMLASVCIVDERKNVVYFTYVIPQKKVHYYRYEFSGIEPHMLEKFNGAKDFYTVSLEVSTLISGCILVGHSLWNDLLALSLYHPMNKIRDTSSIFTHGRCMHKLKFLSEYFLGLRIQNGTHCPIEDARVTMRLYQLFQESLDALVYELS